MGPGLFLLENPSRLWPSLVVCTYFIMGILYHSKIVSSLSVLQEGVENTIETAVNRGHI
jgi:hypothetical protein